MPLICLLQVDTWMKLSLWAALGLLVSTCALMYALVLDSDPFQDQSLGVLNALFAYPIVGCSAFSLYQVGHPA